MRLARTLVLTIAAALGLGGAVAFACTVHAYGTGVHATSLPTSLDLLFAPRPKVTGFRLLANLNPGVATTPMSGRTGAWPTWGAGTARTAPRPACA